MQTTTPEIQDYADRIRSAYARISPTPGELVSLGDLRPEVGGHRPLVDAALRHLGRQRGVTLVPEANQKMLTDWERQCAINVGDQDKHAISIS